MTTDRPLDDGRVAYDRKAWGEAYRLLSLADREAPLAAEDLELLTMAAILSGRDEDFLRLGERTHQAFLESGQALRAVRAAFWLGFRLIARGETGRATGWFTRARRLLEREDAGCAENGYLLLPEVQRQLAAGETESAYATAVDAARIGDRCGDADLSAFARHMQGRIMMRQGQVDHGLALLDEAMVAVTAGELSPVITGVIYCSVIDGCQQVYALDRAREWTSAMVEWSAAQTDLVAFSGTCLVHRAEIMQLRGAWAEALETAVLASERCLEAGDRRTAGAAFYQQAEVHRLRGELDEAEAAYRQASQLGWEPQPGLALLRAASGSTAAAAAAIRRVLSTTTDRLHRARLLPAAIDIMLKAGETDEARDTSTELEEIARHFESDVLNAIAAHSRGAVLLAAGDPQAALGSLSQARQVWQKIEAPYLAARARVLIAAACRALGDEEGSQMEADAARAIFEQLGAAPDLTALSAGGPSRQGAEPPSRRGHGLSPRELQVLRLVAAGKTNKAIAAELHLSEKTIDRHVSNIFVKLDVPSRAAATAFAYKERMIGD